MVAHPTPQLKAEHKKLCREVGKLVRNAKIYEEGG